MRWFSIPIASLSVADVQAITVNSKRLTVVKNNDNFYVFTNKCPHAGAALSNGWCKEGFLICPVHRYQYQLENGRGAIGQGDYLKSIRLK